MVDDETAVHLFEVESGMIRFDDRTTLRAKPLVGCLAVAPEGTGTRSCRAIRR